MIVKNVTMNVIVKETVMKIIVTAKSVIVKMKTGLTILRSVMGYYEKIIKKDTVYFTNDRTRYNCDNV